MLFLQIGASTTVFGPAPYHATQIALPLHLLAIRAVEALFCCVLRDSSACNPAQIANQATLIRSEYTYARRDRCNMRETNYNSPAAKTRDPDSAADLRRPLTD